MASDSHMGVGDIRGRGYTGMAVTSLESEGAGRQDDPPFQAPIVDRLVGGP